MYVFVLHLLSNSPEWSPLLGTTGAPAPGSSQDPVSLRSRSWNDSNTVPVLVSLMHLLQVCYRFFVHGARVARITGRSRPPSGVGLTPRQYTVWNVEGRARSTGGLSLTVGAAACSALYCQRWEVYYQTSNYPTKNQNNRLPNPVPGWYIYSQ